LGSEFREQLRAAQSPYEMVKEVRGEGMLTGIEFQPPSNLSMRSEIKGCFQGDVGVSPHPGF
jgi:acetylornithine/succinyldiaminopimelate/putrescine aminotransferase